VCTKEAFSIVLEQEACHKLAIELKSREVNFLKKKTP
jgi:hypothetical protein